MNQKKNNKAGKKTKAQPEMKAKADLIIFKPFFVLIIISFITIFIFGSSLKNEIVRLDDDVMIDNLKMLHQNTYHILNESFTRDAMVGIGGDLYRPVQTFLLISLYESGNGNLVYFHVFQIILHILASFLIFILLKTLSFDNKKSLILTLLYTTHPLFSSLVSFIPAIGDQMLVILSVCSFIFLINYLKTNKYIYTVVHIFTFSLAVFTKETALVFPAIFLFYAFFILRLKNYKVLLFPLFFWILVPVIYMFLRQKFIIPDMVASQNILNLSNATHNFLYNIPSFFQFIAKFFIPYKLSFLASYSITRTIMGIVFICGFFALSIFKKLDFKWLIFSLLWYSLFVLPPMLYRNPVFDYGEHRGFLPLISILFLIASLKIGDRAYWLLYILIPLFVAVSFGRINDFKEPIAFYSSIIDNDPVPIAYLNRGAYYHKYKNDTKAAYNDYNKAIELKKDYSTALYNRALLKSETMKDINGAFEDLELAIKAKPNYADAFYERGYLKLTSKNDIKSALKDIDSAIILNPAYVLAYNNRGILKQSYLNDSIGSFNDFNKSILLQPLDNPKPYFYRGMSYYKKNNLTEACKDWSMAKKQGYNQAESFINSYCNK